MPRKKPPENTVPDTMPVSGDWAAIKAGLQELKEQGLADRVELQAQIIRGDLLLRNVTSAAIGRAFATWRNQILDLDISSSDMLTALIGAPGGNSHIVRKIISELSYNAVQKITKRLENFIKGTGK